MAAGSFAASSWNTWTNSRPMILRLASGSDSPCKRFHETVAGIDVNQLDAHVLLKRIDHLLSLVQPQQSGIDEYAGQLIPIAR